MNYEMKLTYFLLFQFKINTTRWLLCAVWWWPGQVRVFPHAPDARGQLGLHLRPAAPIPHHQPPPGTVPALIFLHEVSPVAADLWPDDRPLPRILNSSEFYTFDTYCHRLFFRIDRTEAWHYYRVCHLIMMLRTVTELSAGWWGVTWPGSNAECVSRVTASNHTPSCGSHSWSHTHFIMISKLRRQYNLVQFSPICGGWWVSQLTTQSDQAWPPPATATTHPPARPACAGGGGQSS